MRRSNRRMILAACAILVPAAIWPVLNLTVLSDAAAQSGPPAARQTMKKGDLFEEISRSRIESILAEPIPEMMMQDKPLRDVLAQLKELTGINMYFDPEELGDIIDPDVPITVDLDENSVTYNTLLKDFILGPEDLRFVIRHNSLVIMSYDKYISSGDAAQFVVYNCRDLLVGRPVRPSDAVPGGVSGGQGAEGPAEEFGATGGTAAAPAAGPTKTENLHQFGMGAGFRTGGFLPAPAAEVFSDVGAREQQLADLIRLTVRNEDYPWDNGSNPNAPYLGTIQAFNGLLVIRTLPEMHEQVRQVLRLLRESAKEKDWPADLGDWPHRRKITPPPKPEERLPVGGGYF